MIMRIFRGSTLFLAGVGVGSVATVAMIGVMLDEHGDKILEGIEGLKEAAKNVDISVDVDVDEPSEKPKEDVVDGSATEVRYSELGDTKDDDASDVDQDTPREEPDPS